MTLVPVTDEMRNPEKYMTSAQLKNNVRGAKWILKAYGGKAEHSVMLGMTDKVLMKCLTELARRMIAQTAN